METTLQGDLLKYKCKKKNGNKGIWWQTFSKSIFKADFSEIFTYIFGIIVRLSFRHVIFEPHILPICLPEKNQEFSNDSVAMVTGWGATEADSIKRPRELQVADVNVVSSELCEKWHQGNNIEVMVRFSFLQKLCLGSHHVHTFLLF
jgi:hypothetical protein